MEMESHSPGADLGAARPQVDFEALFEALPSPYMILDRDLRYVAANAAYCAATEQNREVLIGRGLFELFPNPDEGGRMLRASLERVLATGRPDSLALIPYAIPLAPERGGGMEMRYWSAVHTPLMGPDGQVAFVLQNTVDVTALRAQAGAPAPRQGETQLLQRAEEVQRLNASLAEESMHLRDLIMQAPGFMVVLSGPDHVLELVNNAYLKLVGGRPWVGKSIAEALPELADQGYIALLDQVTATQQPFVGRAALVGLQNSTDAPQEERFLDFVLQPILGADGTTRGIFVEGSDVTDRIAAETQQKFLLDELNHRVKNTLATVQAIAAQTLRHSPDPPAFRRAFEARIMALSATHNLLTATSWRGAELRDVLSMELSPYGAERYGLEGGVVDLSAPAALALGMLVHELATNAAKHGALSEPGGRVEVAWRLAPEGKLVLDWRETGGPPVAVSTHRGFGSRLIERSLRGDLAGAAVLAFHPDGLCCHIELPLGPAI